MQTIAEIKEQTVTQTPLILFDCTLADGSVERWSTHRAQVDGATYEARVLSHSLFEMRSGSDDGIDAITRISITLANADSYFSQISSDNGWRGARLTGRFRFYDLTAGEPMSEATVLFRGLVNPPDEITESVLRIQVTNRLNMQRLLLPDIRIQRRCPWAFPVTEQHRQEAVYGGLKGKYSPYFKCGYSPDQPNGAGNLDGDVPYTGCDYTRSHCEQRGMFDRDSQNRVTRRFGGIEYVPANTLVRGHGESGMRAATILDNEARYNDFVPITYGTAWIQPPVVTARNDGNLTRMEVLLGCGEINRIVTVVANDIEIPVGVSGSNMTTTGWYHLVSAGTPSGSRNADFADSSGQPLGDPYGSMAYLSLVLPNRISEGKTLPKVSVLMEGSRLSTYGEGGAPIGEVFSNNPSWILLDLLRRTGWGLDELDLSSFARVAVYCAEEIPGRDLYGSAVMIPRYACNLSMRKRRSAADLIRAVRNAAGLYLTYGPSGLLELHAEEKVAVQQSEKPTGSNSTETLNGGWPAYEFGDGSQGLSGILRRDNGESSVRLWYRTTAESPNRYTVEFQDEFNEYQQDSLSLVDTEEAIAAGQEVSAVLPAMGLPNFHQAARLIRRQLDKSLRGNFYISFETSVKGVGLRPGDIITVTYLKDGLLRQPFRIVRIAPAINHRTALIEAQVHDESWYIDSTSEGESVSRRQGVWGLGLPRPLVGSVLDSDGRVQFGIEETYLENNDGSVSVRLRTGFSPPAQPGLASVQIPHLSMSPVVTTTGGTLTGGRTIYYAVSAVDAGLCESPLSFVARASIPVGANSNSVTLQGMRFSADAAGYCVYRGDNPSQLFRIASESELTATFADDGLPFMLTGPPDENYDHALFQWRRELSPEVQASAASASTVASNTLQLLPNEFTGGVVRVTRGKGEGQERVIQLHDSSVLTLSTPWSVVPNATSFFVIAEASWNFGSTGSSSPVQFAVPNREGATVHVSGTAVNIRGVGSSRELSPVTRWQIGGSTIGDADQDVPPAPIFGIARTGYGSLEVGGVGFGDLDNTTTVQAGTLTLHFWNELQELSTLVLSAAIDAADTEIALSDEGLELSVLIQIDGEVLEIEGIGQDSNSYTVRRGSHGSAPVQHAEGSLVYRLDRKTYVVPFSRGFFGSPASGSYSFPVSLPDVRLACAEMFMTNLRGNGETTKVSFTSTVDQGVRTLAGGQFTLQVEGYLAIQDAAAPPLVIERAHSVRDIFAVVADAPTGSAVELALRLDGATYCTLSIPEDSTASESVSGFGLPPLEAMSILTLDIVSVGQTAGASPGRDLTVTIRL